MDSRSRSISKFERKTKTNILGRINAPCNKRPYSAGSPNPAAGLIMGRRTKISDYRLVKEATKKIAIFYGDMRHGMLKNYYHYIANKSNNIAIDLPIHLERRLLSVVYRMKWASSQISARQLISHKKILINDQKVNKKSYILKIGDKVSLLNSAVDNIHIKESMGSTRFNIPEYLKVLNDGKGCIFSRLPTISEIEYPFKTNYDSLIEFFDR